MVSSRIYPQTVRIGKIDHYSSSIRGFFFKEAFLAQKAVPGQFAMLWIPGADEIPLGFAMIDQSTDLIGFAVQRVGKGTEELFRLKVGDPVGIRGPFGRGFNLELWKDREVIIVGGGVGMAPLLTLVANEGSQVSLDIFYGAKNQDLLALREVIRKQKQSGSHLHLATEDGSVGTLTTVVDLVQDRLAVTSQKSRLILAAGPERMLLALHYILLEQVPNGDWEFSLCDRYMKCGFGICGSCSLDDLGLRLCVEGPILGRTTLDQLSSFGKHGRDACGRKKYFV